MRVARKEIREKKTIEEILTKCPVGRLGTVSEEGLPMVKPLNYVYLNGSVYFHSAREGEKIDDIRRDNHVCFEVDLPIAYVSGSKDNPCSAAYRYRSVIITGLAGIVDDDAERLRALEALMDKYQPDGGYGRFLPEKLVLTAVVRIDIQRMTGKEDVEA